jgi:hypothetical protein
MGTSAAQAQQMICSQTMRASTCDLLAVPIERELRRLDAPTGWNWVILNEADWRQAKRMFRVESAIAFIVLKLRLSFLNEEYLQQMRAPVPTDALAHELGHFFCACASERKADRAAEILLARRNPHSGQDTPETP